jgi:hypothetical protein
MCCKTCAISVTSPSDFLQCIYLIVDGFVIILLAIAAITISELMLGDEEGLNLFDDIGTFSEGLILKLLAIWKSTIGEIDNTLFNLFNGTFKASAGLSKLVAHTGTMGLSLAMLDIFSGELNKVKGSCFNFLFDFLNTPFAAIKSLLYDAWEPLGYLSDIFLLPFEMVVALMTIVVWAIWGVIKKMTGLRNFLCDTFPSPCCE